MSELAPGVDKENSLRAAGFDDSEIQNWKSQTAQELSNAGFASPEIDDYFGHKNPDMTPAKQVLSQNLLAARQEQADKETGQPKKAQTFLEALDAGWQMSVSGLLKNKAKPDTIVAEDAPRFYKIAAGVSSLAGDVPVMLAGSVSGAAAAAPIAAVSGPAAPLVETAAAGYGAMALPAAMRKVLMDHYEKGDIQTFSDFWDRASATFIEANKQGIVGAATAGVGGIVGKVAAPLVKPAVKTTAQLTSEVATMVTVGNALEGHMPNADDFINGAIITAGFHGAVSTAAKLRNTYIKTGVDPSEVALRAQTDPLLKQDLLTVNKDVPEVLAKENGINFGQENGVPIGGELGQNKPSAQSAPSSKEGVSGPPLRTEAEQKILDQVGVKEPNKSEPYSSQKAYKDFIDKFDPIKIAQEIISKEPENITADQNPYQLARQSNDYKSKVKYAVEKGTIDFKTGATTGKGLEEILKPHAKDLDGFTAYLLSKRALEVEGAGKKSGFNVEAAEKVVSEGGAKYEQASKELVDFQNQNLKYAKDSGILSNESYKTLVNANKSYVPFSRILDPQEAAAGKTQGKANSLKALKGVGEDVQTQNPFISIVENTETLFKLAEKNRASRALVELAEKNPGQDLIKKVPLETKVTSVEAADIRRSLEDQGIITTKESVTRALKAKGLPVTEEMVAKAFKKENLFDKGIEGFDIFRRQAKTNLADNEFSVYRNGKKEVWEVKDKDLAQAIKALDGDPGSTNVIFKLMRNFTGVKRLAISMTPDFILKNIFRDQLTAGTFTKSGSMPFIDSLVAMKDIWNKSDAYYNWLKSGGAGGTFLDLQKDVLSKDLYGLNEKTGFMDKSWNIVKTPLEKMAAAAALGEQATRLAEFKKVSEGQSSGPKLFEGGFAAREVTVDFSRIGAKMSALNAITAFQNVAIQGLDRTVRAIKEDPKGVTTKALAYITVPSILLWYANHDDERYKGIPNWEKNTFWHIITDDWQKATPMELKGTIPEHLKRTNKNGEIEINKGIIFRVPKPQELGLLFGSLPERTLDKFFLESPGSLSAFKESMVQALIPSIVPDAISPVGEQFFNKSLFTGNKIIPGYLEDIAPQYQYTSYTSETAKQLAKMIKYVPGVGSSGAGDLSLSSPIVLDNYARSWAGNYGVYALRLADAALYKSGLVPDPIKPDDTMSDIPFVKAFFTRNPSMGDQRLQDFYENAGKQQMIFKTLDYLRKSQDFEALNDQLMRLSNGEDLPTKLDGFKNAISKQTQLIRVIYKDPQYTKDEKRQLIDGLTYGILETAAGANKFFDQVKKATEEAQKANKGK